MNAHAAFAGDLVQGPPVTVRSRSSLRDVVRELGNQGLGIVVVVEDDIAVGVVSERDVVWALARDAVLDDVWAGDVMTRDLVRVDHGAKLDKVMSTMIEHNTRHVLVGTEAVPAVVSMRQVAEHLH